MSVSAQPKGKGGVGAKSSTVHSQMLLFHHIAGKNARLCLVWLYILVNGGTLIYYNGTERTERRADSLKWREETGNSGEKNKRGPVSEGDGAVFVVQFT